MNTIKFKTSKRITAPKLWGSDLLVNIYKETEKAYLLDDVVQEHGLLHLSKRWMAKSQITNIQDEERIFEYDYDHLYGAQPAKRSELREVMQK